MLTLWIEEIRIVVLWESNFNFGALETVFYCATLRIKQNNRHIHIQREVCICLF